MKNLGLSKKGIALLMATGLAIGMVTGTNSGNINAQSNVAVDAESLQVYGDSETENVIEISSATELRKIAERVNNGESFEGKIIRLTKDIVFDGVTVNNFSIIGDSEERCFSGIFDGNGFSISGIIKVKKDSYGGIFKYTKGAVIKDLTVKDCEFSTISDYGLACHAESSVFYNCTIEKSVLMKESGSAGLVYEAEKSTFVSCKNYADLSEGAGIVYNASDSEVFQCFNYGNISGNYTAGIVRNATRTKINECENRGRISGKTYAGGIVNEASDSNLLNCINYGEVESGINLETDSSENCAGGIVAKMQSGTIGNCANQGNVKGKSYYQNNYSYYYNENEERLAAGGLVGIMLDGMIQNAYSAGDFTNAAYLVGRVEGSSSVVSNCCHAIASSSGVVEEQKSFGYCIGTIRKIEGKTADEMKSNEFVALLNKNRGENTGWNVWQATEKYPIVKHREKKMTMINNKFDKFLEPGKTITLTLREKKGQELIALSINNGAVEYKGIGENKYEYIMPDSDVYIVTRYQKTTESQAPSSTPSVTPVSTPTFSTPTTAPQEVKDPVQTTTPTTQTPAVSKKVPTVVTNKKSATLYVNGNTGNKILLTTQVMNTTKYELSFLSGNEKVAKVTKSGEVTAKGTGTTTIFAVLVDKEGIQKNYNYAVCNITVKAANLTFVNPVKTLKIKKKATFKVKLTGLKGTVKWSASDKKKATINQKGVVTAKKAGKVTVTAACGKVKKNYVLTIKK